MRFLLRAPAAAMKFFEKMQEERRKIRGEVTQIWMLDAFVPIKRRNKRSNKN